MTLKYSNFKELLEASDKYSGKLTKHNPEALARKLIQLNLLQVATSEASKKNYEVAYEHLYKLMECALFLVSKDKGHYTKLFGPDYKKAVEMAEKLKIKLEDLYAEKQKVDEILPDDVEEIDLRDSEVLTESCASEDSRMISTANLYTALRSTENNLKILMVDLRSKKDFKTSHISQKLMAVPVNVINIPGASLHSGLSAGSLTSCMTPEGRKLWEDRGSFDQIILIDASNDYGKAENLKGILMKFDTVTYNEGSIKFLNDGYKAWVEAYESSDDSNECGTSEYSNTLIEVNYDIPYENDEIINDKGTPDAFPKERPVVDRSSKTHALQKYGALELLKKRKELENERNETKRQYDELRRQTEEKMEDERIDELSNFYLDKIKELEAKNAELNELNTIKEEKKGFGAGSEEQLVATSNLRNREPAVVKGGNGDVSGIVQNSSEYVTNGSHKVAPPIPSINRSTKPRPIKRRDPPIIGVSPGLTGLKNLGNTCYMNSILQCISNNSDLMEYFSSNVYQLDLNRNHRTRGEVARNVAQVVHQLWGGNQKVYAARDLKNVVGTFKTEYKSSEQQDSHEFLTFLMDWLHNDLNKVDPAPTQDIDSYSDMDKAWIKFQVKNKSQISKLFYGLQKSTVSCLVCKEQSATYEPFSNLSLSIPNWDDVQLEHCIEEYLKGEKISGWRCPKCKKEQHAERKTELCKLPVMLVIHLKRFGFYDVQSTKKTTAVNFPLDNLDLHSTDQRKSYSLYGVSNHYGTMETGHYTAFCKNYQHSRWYRFDDHEVSELPASKVVTTAAYILFYSSNGPFMAAS